MSPDNSIKPVNATPLTAWTLFPTDIITILLSATLLIIPVEDGRFWILGFIGIVPLMLRMWRRSYRAIFLLGFFTFYLYLFYCWEWITVYGFHWRLTLAFMDATSYALVFMISFWLMRKYRSHLYALVFPALLALLEYRQTLGFLGFPWMLLCHTQHLNLPMIQIVSITGSFGITFLLGWVNAAISHVIAGRFSSRALSVAIPPAILVGIVGLYGAISLSNPVEPENINVTLVQGSESTLRQWTSNFNQIALENYMRVTVGKLTEPSAMSQMSDDSDETLRLVIWPETSIPEALRGYNYRTQIQGLSNAFDATFIVGCLTMIPGTGEEWSPDTGWPVGSQYREYNSLVAFEPDGSVKIMYSKIHLVPFGEVIPLKEIITGWFPEYPWGAYDISPGDGMHVTDTPVGKIGAVICYESLFPQITREAVLNGAEIMVLGSNTSWFQRTRASYQHSYMDVFRAVENGIWFCRAATTGVSSIIDPQGRVRVESDIFVDTAVGSMIGRRNHETFYTRYGDWIVSLCGAYILVLMLGVFLLKPDHKTH